MSGGRPYARATVDVPAGRLARTPSAPPATTPTGLRLLRLALRRRRAGRAASTIVAHLWSTPRRHGVLLRTRVPRGRRRASPSIVDVFPGAAWHERETHEMFGVDFAGHPGLTPLLLPPEFEGHPLRKEFVLAARVAKPWPGAKEPGESRHGGRPSGPPMRPPGVPDPGEWGPPGAPGTAPPARRHR